MRHAEAPDLAQVRPRLEQTPQLLCLGPEAVVYAILDQVVDEYGPVVAGLENDIDEIEDQFFDGDPAVSRRIYDLSGSLRRSLRRWGRSRPQSWMTRAETSSKSPHVRNPPPVRQAIAIQAASVKIVA